MEINVGDVVTLRSGGIRMTVTSIADGRAGVAFDGRDPFGSVLSGGTTRMTHVYPVDCLMVVDPFIALAKEIDNHYWSDLNAANTTP